MIALAPRSYLEASDPCTFTCTRQSCGYAVPYYDFRGHRQVLLDYLIPCERADQNDPAAHAEKGLKAYWEQKNLQSIDGLPGLIQGLDAVKNSWNY